MRGFNFTVLGDLVFPPMNSFQICSTGFLDLSSWGSWYLPIYLAWYITPMNSYCIMTYHGCHTPKVYHDIPPWHTPYRDRSRSVFVRAGRGSAPLCHSIEYTQRFFHGLSGKCRPSDKRSIKKRWMHPHELVPCHSMQTTHTHELSYHTPMNSNYDMVYSTPKSEFMGVKIWWILKICSTGFFETSSWGGTLSRRVR